MAKVRKGVTLVEVMVAILVFVVAVLGSSFAFAFGRGEIKRQEQQRIAVLLASQAMDELKATDYDLIQNGETKTTLSLENPGNDIDSKVIYSRTVVVNDSDADDGTYKFATVTMNWGQTASEHSLTITTIISSN